MEKKFECQCEYCKNACTFNPGWFLPGEAEKVADYLKISLQNFFDQYLGVNWWEGDSPTFVLAPALVGKKPGTEYPGDPRGQCVFYKNELCEIHDVKPCECAQLICNDPEIDKRHRKVADAWQNHQEQIVSLLGRNPIAEKFYGGGSLLGSIFD